MGCSCACCTPMVKMVYSGIGVAFGLCAGTFYAIVFHNISSSTIAIVSSFFAALYFYMHYTYRKHGMVDWKPSTFKQIFYINLILFIIFAAGMVACLVLAGVNHQGFATKEDLMGENLWMTGIWCFIIAKWQGMNAYYAKAYSAEALLHLMHASASTMPKKASISSIS